jgi:hypothetical protein
MIIHLALVQNQIEIDYDFIKAHCWETKEGKGVELIIKLPLINNS